jgi:hypothetical protein
VSDLNDLNGSERARAIAWLEERGVPSLLFPWCWIPPGATLPAGQAKYLPDHVYLMDTPDSPPLTQKAQISAAVAGMGVRTYRTAPASFTELASFLEWGVALQIEGAVSWWSDWNVVESASELAHLAVVSDPPEPFDVAKLPALTSLKVEGTSWGAALELTQLRKLEYVTSSRSTLPSIAAPLTELYMCIGKKIEDLSFLNDATQLEMLSLERVGHFDARALLAAPRLEFLRINRADSIQNAGALTELRHLRLLRLHEVREIDDVNRIAELDLDDLYVAGNYCFDDEFRRKVSSLRGHWGIEELRKPKIQNG